MYLITISNLITISHQMLSLDSRFSYLNQALEVAGLKDIFMTGQDRLECLDSVQKGLSP